MAVKDATSFMGTGNQCDPADEPRGRLLQVPVRRLIFPAIFLFYLLSTAAGISKHSNGAWVVVGGVALALFCIAYLCAFPRCGPGTAAGSGGSTR